MIKDCPLPKSEVVAFVAEQTPVFEKEIDLEAYCGRVKSKFKLLGEVKEKIFVGGVFQRKNDEFLTYLFVIDSGATSHMVGKIELMNEFSLERTIIEQAEEGRNLISPGKGEVNVKIIPSGISLKLRDVMLIPSMGLNILSVKKLCTYGYKVIFTEKYCVITDQTGSELIKAEKVAGLYQLKVKNVSHREKVLALANLNSRLRLWHNRLGHLNEDVVRKMISNEKFESERLQCVSCIQAKMIRGKFSERSQRNPRKFGLVHSDVCGPFEVNAVGGYRYFVTFIDDFSGFCFAYLIRQKSEVFTKFKELFMIVKNSYKCTIGIIRSDNGGEYFSNSFRDFLKENGVLQQSSIPYTPQQNGVAERMNRTLQECIRSMLTEAQLSKKYWGYALKCAVFIRNQCISTSTKRKAPSELLNGTPPKLNELHVFGCICYVHVQKEKRLKLDARAIKCIFLGYR